jgi:Flp pilus assembly protein TadG
MMRFVNRFLKDRSGLSAVEFGLLLPVMITSYFGVAEIGNYILADRKVTSVASTAADLVAQSTQVSDAGMADIMASLSVVIQPFNANDCTIRITSVTADALGVTKVAWSDALRTSPRAVGSTISMPTGLVPANQSVIFAEVSFNYKSVVGMFLQNGITVTDQFYQKPRKTLAVQRVS